jgi:hypothetical protein
MSIRANFEENEAIRNSRCSNEENKFFWFKGGSLISVVDMKSFACEDYDIIRSRGIIVVF